MTKTLIAIATVLASLTVPSAVSAQDMEAVDFISRIEGVQPAGDGNAELGAMTIDLLLDHFNVPGVSVAVIKDFKIDWAKGYGVADVETDARVDTETMFQAASVSKPVAAMAVLKAVQDGLFGLDDDINDILTSWRLDGGDMTAERPVTPRSLTSHTSGLGDAFGFPGYDPDVELPTLVQIFEGHKPSNVRKLFMERPPYQAFEYSGGGVTLMQQALIDACGRPFPQILQDDVLTPIGMTRSSYAQPISPENNRNAARAHDGKGASRGPKWHVYPEMAAAGLWTTASDLARYAIEVQRSAIGESNRVLSRAMVQEMLSPVGVGDFAVGFTLSKIGEGWYFRHGGSNWGFRSTLMAHKVKGYGLAIMTNGDRGGGVMNEISQRIQRAYEWDSMAQPVPRGYAPPVERTEVQVPVDILGTYVGAYVLNPQLTLAVTLENGALFLKASGQGKLPIFPESETKFFLKVVDAQLTFTRSDGAVDGVILHQNGQDLRAPRAQSRVTIPPQ